jgi:DinB superfamily
MTERPDRTEAAEYYFTYIDKVVLAPGETIAGVIEAQRDEVLELCATVSEARASHRYAPDKWSLRQVLSHLNDTERVFAYRALWFARCFTEVLPSFDQNVAIASAGADDRSWASHVREFEAVRDASIALFGSLTDDAWPRRGSASGYPFTVRALAFMTAGHVAHHLAIVRERYLAG